MPVFAGFAAIGVAVAGGIGISVGAIGAIAIGVATSAIVGAAIGGLTAAVTGGDIGKGMLYGAVGGLVVGGVFGGAIVGSAASAGGTALTSQAGGLTGSMTATTVGGNVVMSNGTVFYGATQAAAAAGGGIGTGMGTLGQAALSAGPQIAKGLLSGDSGPSSEDMDKQRAHEKEMLQMKLDAPYKGPGHAPFYLNERIALQRETVKGDIQKMREQETIRRENVARAGDMRRALADGSDRGGILRGTEYMAYGEAPKGIEEQRVVEAPPDERAVG